ncbi:hypothetical protein DRJ22_03140 [Candidatus Woesearchaeota archaeon]|nr:MAG: hypothetical protein B6U93_01150 [Candidatus Woesearchaeota archaeon ex4484_78]RLE45960.1 MAG: hypothetical protein DRJ22_03140 [Candidatus Woesearchaeota archaeon]
MKNKIVLGLTSNVLVFGKKKKKLVTAKVDTGATKTSIDIKLAKELGIGPELKKTIVKSAHGTRHRSVVLLELSIGGEIFETEATLADRAHLKYPLLLGQNVLKKGFLIDPSKKVVK